MINIKRLYALLIDDRFKEITKDNISSSFLDTRKKMFNVFKEVREKLKTESINLIMINIKSNEANKYLKKGEYNAVLFGYGMRISVGNSNDEKLSDSIIYNFFENKEELVKKYIIF